MLFICLSTWNFLLSMVFNGTYTQSGWECFRGWKFIHPFRSKMNDNVCQDEMSRFLFNPKNSPGCARAAALNYCSKYYFDGKPIQFREEYTNGWDEIGSNPIDTTDGDVVTLGLKEDGYGTSLHFPQGDSISYAKHSTNLKKNKR